jgi:hypothetical protein
VRERSPDTSIIGISEGKHIRIGINLNKKEDNLRI